MPKPISLIATESGFRVEDYPNAVALKNIDSHPAARQLNAFSLHGLDVAASAECLHRLNNGASVSDAVTAHALWHWAITSYFKCFDASKSRSSLNKERIFHSDLGALEDFKFFENLRDKHLVHDENEFAQATTALVINPEGAARNIADAISLPIAFSTLNLEYVRRLVAVVDQTLRWVDDERDKLHAHLCQEFEKRGREELLSLPDTQLKVADPKNVGASRSATLARRSPPGADST